MVNTSSGQVVGRRPFVKKGGGKHEGIRLMNRFEFIFKWNIYQLEDEDEIKKNILNIKNIEAVAKKVKKFMLLLKIRVQS